MGAFGIIAVLFVLCLLGYWQAGEEGKADAEEFLREAEEYRKLCRDLEREMVALTRLRND